MLSAAIMAHSSRSHFVYELTRELLDRPARVIWDQAENEWDTGRRALLAFDPAATHHLVIQDDAIPCRDLVAGAERAAAAAGKHPVGFYVGQSRLGHRDVSHMVKHAASRGASWLEMDGPWWGVALAVPTADIEELVAWGDRNPGIRDYDKRITRWYRNRGISCWYTVPSLVDHRSASENPSLFKDRPQDRRAHHFIGAERSALDIDWDQAPLPAVVRFLDLRKQATYEARLGTARYRRMVNNPSLERVE